MTLSKNVTYLDNTSRQQTTNWMLFVGIILISSNLRAPLTSVGALITFIRDDLGISNTLAGSLTTLPLLTFALFSPFVPKIAARIGMELTIFIALGLLTIGIIVRSLFGVGPLFIGTTFVGLGVAIGNVLLPAFIKMNFPLKVGIMTGIYGISMNIFGALGAGLSVPFSSIGGFGWQGALGIWALLSFIACLIWMPQLSKRQDTIEVDDSPTTGNIWRSSLAWFITIFMGLQSLVFYTLMTWIPDILQTLGYSSSAAGWLLFLMQFSIIPITFIMPLLAEKMRHQIALSVMTASLLIVGIMTLIVGHTFFIPVAMILIGVGCGSAFSLSMMFFTLRTSDGKQAAEISGMAQSFGYLLAATGPVLFGALHDMNGGWTLPLSMLIIIAFIILIAGIEAGKDRVISHIPKQEKGVF